MDQPEPGVFEYKFKIPEKLGIFKFMINHNRYGQSFLESSTEVSIIQFRHNEFARYIPVAFPYYASIFSTMGATLLFVCSFLFSDLSHVKGIQKQQ
jgi:oligosaccharyltransferase complex subunit beta